VGIRVKICNEAEASKIIYFPSRSLGRRDNYLASAG
jgi:hypothetical protein